MDTQDKRLNEVTKQLIKLYQDAQKKIKEELASNTDYSRNRANEALAKIDLILQDLHNSTNTIGNQEVQEFYGIGFDRANQSMPDGVTIDMGVIDTEAISALQQEFRDLNGQAIQSVKRSSSILVNTAVNDRLEVILAEGLITGKSERKLTKEFVNLLADSQIAITDKAGRQWSITTYANMLVRTHLTNSANQGLANRMARSGDDLVKVSKHNGQYPCAEWEGKILSLRGETPGVPTVDYAKASPQKLFRPNCTHFLIPYHVETQGEPSEKQTTPPGKKQLQKQEVRKKPVVSIGGRDIEVTQGELDFINRRDIKLNVDKSKKRSLGYYTPAYGEIFFKQSTLNADDYLITFFHELGHAIDYEKNLTNETRNKWPALGLQLSRQKKFRDIYDEEKLKIMVARFTRDSNETRKMKKFILPKVEDYEKMLAGKKVSFYDQDNNLKGDSIMKTNYRRYLGNKEEIFADGYTQYKNQPNEFKKYAPKMYKYFKELEGSL